MDVATEVDDLQPLYEELAALREALGSSYQHLGYDVTADDVDAAGPSSLPAGTEAMPFLRVGASRLEVVQAALQANLALQQRLKRLMESIVRAQDKCVGVRDLLKATQGRRSAAAAAPTSHPAGTRPQTEFTGASWYWSTSSAAPPPYPDAATSASVMHYLPLVVRRTAWSDEERKALSEGVLTLVQERLLNGVLAELEAGLAAGGCVSVQDFEARQKPIGALTPASPEVLAAAEAFEPAAWQSVAHRAVPTRTATECRLHWHNWVRPGLKHEPFSKEEDVQLKELVGRLGERDWVRVAAELGSGDRLPLECMARFQQLAQSRPVAREFSEDDLARLNALVREHGQTWRRVADEFGGGWEATQLMHFWRRHEQRRQGGDVQPRKGKWTQEETDVLRRAVALYGRKWSKVATAVPGRTDVQCRERYVNVLNPEVSTGIKFSREELALLTEMVPQYTRPDGTVKWAALAREHLPGRTDSQISRRWQLLTKQAEEAGESGEEAQLAGEEDGATNAGNGAGPAADHQPARSGSQAAGQRATNPSKRRASAKHKRKLVQPEERSDGSPSASGSKYARASEAEDAAAEEISHQQQAVQQIAPQGTSRSGRKVRPSSRLAD